MPEIGLFDSISPRAMHLMGWQRFLINEKGDGKPHPP